MTIEQAADRGAPMLARASAGLSARLRREWSDPLRSTCWTLLCVSLPLLMTALVPWDVALRSLVEARTLHDLAQIFAIVVAMLVFGVTWNAYGGERSGNLVILACVLFAAALIDFAEMLALRGLDFVLPANIALTAGLTIVALRHPGPLPGRNARWGVLGASLMVVVPVYWAVFGNADALEQALDERRALASIEHWAEYGLAAALVLPAARFYAAARRSRSEEAAGLFGTTAMAILALLSFARYEESRGGLDLLGYLYRIGAYGFVYRAVFMVCVREPFERLLAAERRMRMANELLERMFENVQVQLAYLDRDFNFRRVNARYAEAAGHPAAFFASRNHFALYPDPATQAIFRRVVETGAPYAAYAAALPHTGERCWDWRVDAVKDSGGAVQGIVLSRLDVTERVRHDQILGASLEESIQAIAATVESRDPYTAGHQRRVAALAVAIARALGLGEERIRGLHLAATIHDLGKIHIPAEILAKPGRLSTIEFELMKQHPRAGWEILKDVRFPWPIAQTILQHHERYDGSGYPQGLRGEAIILEARIVSVADVAESMASHRPYRAALGLEAAMAEIVEGRGKAFDPDVVDAFARVVHDGTFAFEATPPR